MDILGREQRLEFPVCGVQLNAISKGRGHMLEEAWPVHAIKNSLAITKYC